MQVPSRCNGVSMRGSDGCGFLSDEIFYAFYGISLNGRSEMSMIATD